MLQSIEGIYKDGSISLSEIPKDINEGRVIVTFLEAKPKQQTKQMIYLGMFANSKQSTEEDFQIAEFTGDRDDNLDWS
jgi:hypothetical protein